MLKLHGEVSLDGSGWEAGLSRIEHATERTMDVVKGLAIEAFGVYGIEQAIQKTVEYGEKIVDTSRRVGVGIESLQEFSYAAKQNGSDIEALTGFIEKLNSARIDPKKASFFQQLGISSDDLRSKGVEDIMMKLSLSAKSMSSQELIGPLRQIGGRGAGSMIPMLKDELGELREEAHHLGLVMKSETALELKDIADRMKILAQIVVVHLGPAIVGVMEKLLKFVNFLRAVKEFTGQEGKNVGGRTLTALGSFIPGPAGGLIAGYGRAVSDVTKEGGLVAGIKDAFESAKDKFKELNEGDEKRFQDMLRRQKELENINADPEFDLSGGKDKVPREHKERLATDSLVKVGNFLGSSRDIIADIAKQQLQELQKIRAALTSGISNGNSDMGIPLV